MNDSPSCAAPASHPFTDRPIRKRGTLLDELVHHAQALPPVRTGVVHPCDASSLEGALAAAERKLIVPTLIGPRGKIEAVARSEEHTSELQSP